MSKKILELNNKAEVYHGEKSVCSDLVISAHQDDIEIMCPQGIIKCINRLDLGLVSVVVTDGAGSPRSGEFENCTDSEMMEIRWEEQREASRIGDYTDLIMLKHTSATLKDRDDLVVTNDLESIVRFYSPQTIYIHNLADKHPTHVNVALRSIDAIRRLDKDIRPKKLYGCEVWRSLDWLSDNDKVVFDLSGHDALLNRMLSVFKSQIAGGKRYDLATEGRRRANATYANSHGVDNFSMAAYAMDLTILIEDDTQNVREFILRQIDKFKSEIHV
ncbi:MAG: PIG-L family deacetylase [Christensenellaceae bacterium]|jgi:LmbE family N-acetylglucosaminyl deacetylase|nr:PIG-L family deacetylase [Christensenellaceae bacterium]